MNIVDKITKYLNEAPMTVAQALKIFGTTQDRIGKDSKLLDTMYKLLAKKHHPDKGGSVEMMKDINNAHDVLSKLGSTPSSSIDWKEINRKHREAAAYIKQDLLNTFQPDKFIKYFNKLTGADFKYRITKEFPKKTDTSPSFAGFYAEFYTDDRSTVFDMDVTASTLDVVYSGSSLGMGDISYPLTITAFGFHNNKKQKLSQQDWSHTNQHKSLYEPSMIFPETKIKKIVSGKTSARKFSRRDMILFLQKKLDARIDYSDGVHAIIPINDDLKLYMFRFSFRKFASWSNNGLYSKHRRVSILKTGSFPETEDSAVYIEKMVKSARKKKDEKSVANELNKYIDNFKEKRVI